MENKWQRQDTWNAGLYDQQHSFVSQFGKGLVDVLAPQQGEKILDLGCGTGDLAHQLTEAGAVVTAIDQSKTMIDQAKSKYPNLTFYVRDVQNLDYQAVFDTVFSNAVLHWVKPPKQALHQIHDSLKQGGRFVAEFGGKGNVKLITDEIIHQLQQTGITHQSEQLPWYFPSVGEYTTLMEEVGFRVILAQHFDRPTLLEGEDGLSNWIEMFAASMFTGVKETTKQLIISKAADNLKEALYINGRWTADYKRLRVIGIKE